MNEPRIALWPPMVSTRERLRITEAVAHLRRRGNGSMLGEYVPVVDRSVTMTTYGKGAFELAVVDAGLSGTRMIFPAFISHDYVGVLQKYDITPVFVDVEPDTFHLATGSCNEELLESASSLVLLHTFGLPADGAGFRDLCDRHGLYLMEDCARALGARTPGGLVGIHGDYSAFSLSKIAPVRRGGLLVSRRPIADELPKGRAGISGVVNQLFLLKVPGLKVLEGPLYRLLRETQVYPGEIGLYEPPDLEAPEPLVEFFLEAFVPHYGRVLESKRATAVAIREKLEPLGFEFQRDPGNHIYTALGAKVPPAVDRRGLRDHLHKRAINSYTLWGDPLGTSALAAAAWGTDPTKFPVAAELAERLIHFPIGRFITDGEVDRLVAACREYVAGGAGG